MRSKRPAERAAPGRPGELIAVLAAGAIHVGLELGISEAVAFAWSAAVAVGFAVYLIRRARRVPDQREAWGFRADNLLPALAPHLLFALAGSLALGAWGAAAGTLRTPPTFWLTLALYPAWGLAQQFALQHLITGNLATALRSPVSLALAGAFLFAISHVPRMDLVGLTLAGGVPFIVLYRRFPNLWAVGLAHGALGTCTAYFVLGEDPGAVILGWFG